MKSLSKQKNDQLARKLEWLCSCTIIITIWLMGKQDHRRADFWNPNTILLGGINHMYQTERFVVMHLSPFSYSCP